MGSDAGSSVIHGGIGRREGSLGGMSDVGKTPGEEALRAVFKDFQESANAKIARICARPLVCAHFQTSLMSRIPIQHYQLH
jgi:hypothetical protein